MSSREALQGIARVPGIHLPAAVVDRFAPDRDPVAAGRALAREVIAGLRHLPGLHGLHLMRFGPAKGIEAELLGELSIADRPEESRPWPSPV